MPTRSVAAIPRTAVPTLIALALAGALSALTACSSSGASSTEAGGPATSTSPQASNAAQPSASTVADPSTGGAQASAVVSSGTATGVPNVCGLLPATDVARLTHTAISDSRPQAVTRAGNFGCYYKGSGDELGVTVISQDAASSFVEDQHSAGDAKSIPGLGAQAFSSNALGTVVVDALFGNTMLTVHNADSVDHAVALIRALQPKL